MNTDSTPYFATNKEWYYENPDFHAYHGCLLTEEGKKIPEVVKSYNDYYDINNPLLYDGDADIDIDCEPQDDIDDDQNDSIPDNTDPDIS